MVFYIANMLLIILEGLFFQSKKYKSERNDKIYVALVGVQFILLAGLRDISIGGDTDYYVEHFETIDIYTWPKLVLNLIHSFWTERWRKGVGYDIFVKIFHAIIPNERVFLIAVAFLVFVPLAIYIYRNSKDYSLSYIVYACLFFQVFGITGNRQALALTLVSVVGYKFVKEQKLISYLLIVFAGVIFHKTALIMLPFYFVCNVRLKKWQRALYLALVGGVFALKGIIIQVANYFTGYGYETTSDHGKPMNMVIIMIGVTIFALWKYDELIERREQNIHFINAILLGTMILPLTQINNVFMRLCYYYYIFLMFLLPEFLLCFKGKLRMLITVGGYVAMMLLFARHGIEYKFFW